MKITNLSETVKDVSWKLGDYFTVESGNLKRICHTEGRGYFVSSIDDLVSTAEYSTKKHWSSIEMLVEDYGDKFGMNKVMLKEIIVENT